MNSFMACERWRIRGRVQRVGFRYFSMRNARRRNVEGAARNEPDGTVEIIAMGRKEDLDAFYRDISKGPSLAHVTDVDRQSVAYDAIDLDSYDIVF